MKEKKKQRIYRVIMFILVTALLGFLTYNILNYNSAFSHFLIGSSSKKTVQKLDALLATVTELIEENYIEDVDEEKLIDGALEGLANAVGDRYTKYYSKEEMEEFQTDTIGKFVGIGVYLQTDGDVIRIIETMPNSPAEAAGLQMDDIILKANDVEYPAEKINELTIDIKGEEGTTVKLTIKRGEEVFDVDVTRGFVHVNYVSGEVMNDNIGYIYLSKFDENSAEDFKKQYEELAEKNIKGLIIDLRDNSGGVVDDALKIADYICKKDDIILYSIGKDGKETITKSQNDPIINMPIVMLTNEDTASSSEILVAALKDNGYAKVVGTTTFGKGVIQELISLSNGGAIRVTSAEYYTPKKEKINEIGIKPDYEVEYDMEKIDVDEPLNKALEVLNDEINK